MSLNIMLLRYSLIVFLSILPRLSGAETLPDAPTTLTPSPVLSTTETTQQPVDETVPEPALMPVVEAEVELELVDTAPAVDNLAAEDDLESPEFQAYLEHRKTPPDTERVKILLDISGTAAAAQNMLRELIVSLSKAHTNVPANVWQDLQQTMTKDAVFERIVPIYQQHYSQRDIELMLNFYASAVGQRFVEKQPLVAQQAFTVSQQWAAELTQKITVSVTANRVEQPVQPTAVLEVDDEPVGSEGAAE